MGSPDRTAPSRLDVPGRPHGRHRAPEGGDAASPPVTDAPSSVRPVPPRGCVTCGPRTPAGRSRSSARRRCPACPRRCGTRSSAGSSRRRHGFVGRRGPSPSPRLPFPRVLLPFLLLPFVHPLAPAGRRSRSPLPCLPGPCPTWTKSSPTNERFGSSPARATWCPRRSGAPQRCRRCSPRHPCWHRSPDRPRLHRRPARADRHRSPDRPRRPSSRLSPIPGQPLRRRPQRPSRPCPSPSSSGCGTNRRRGSRPSRCPAWRPHRCSADGSPDRHAATGKRGEFPFGPSRSSMP